MSRERRAFPAGLILRVGLGLALAAALVTAGAAGARGAEIAVPGQAPSIAAALERAQPGDTVRLAPGRYRERVAIRTPVTLQGPSAGDPPAIVDGGGTGHVIEVFAPGAVVAGLVVQASGDSLSDRDACIYVHGEAEGAVVRDNRLTDCAFGIWVNGTRQARVLNNDITGRPRPIFSDRGNGINLWEMKEGEVRGNTIRQARDGVYLSVTADSVVADNRMEDLRFGVHYMYSDRNQVTGNVTCDSQVGLALMFSKRLEVRGNRAVRNRDHGILFRSVYDTTIAENLLLDNGKGMFLNDASFNEIVGNRVAGNDVGVHITGGSEDNRVVGNSFVRNQVQVNFNWRYPMHWDDGERGNYWSDYLGWDWDGDGIGERTYYASNRMDQLVFRYPAMRVLAHSPIVQLMQALEAQFPVLRPASVVDRRPAMSALPVPHEAESPCGPPPEETGTAAAAAGEGGDA